MNNLAILELQSWSEIAALVGVITGVWGVLSAVLVMWLNTKYVGKPHFYATKDETHARIMAIDGRVAAIELGQALASAPITALQASINDMKEQLDKLTAAVGGMKESVTEGLHAIDKRTTLLEATATNGGRTNR